MIDRAQPDVANFQMAAATFCRLLESTPSDKDTWAEQVLAVLSRLYACAHDLKPVDLDDAPDVPDSLDVTDAQWRDVIRVVDAALGKQRMYWSYFDPSEPMESHQETVCGDLADDLADIYRDIKPGLRAWESGEDAYLPSIVFSWKEPLFASHWGVHAVSAMRALHPIASLRGIQEGHAG